MSCSRLLIDGPGFLMAEPIKARLLRSPCVPSQKRQGRLKSNGIPMREREKNVPYTSPKTRAKQAMA
jgi:hypothetical protein